jgi:hypothetical protein
MTARTAAAVTWMWRRERSMRSGAIFSGIVFLLALAADASAGPWMPKAALAREQAAAAARDASPAGYSRYKDPQWYAEQQALLQVELDRIEGSLRVLRDFRKAGRIINGAIGLEQENPGITPEAGMANLERQRHDILRKRDALEDLAHRHDVPPGQVRLLADRLVERIQAAPRPQAPAAQSEEPAPDIPDPGKDPEAYWRKRFADQRERLFWAEKELSILVRETGELWTSQLTMYFPDPNKAVREQLTFHAITRHRKAIEDKRKEVERLRRGLSDLEDDLRRAGGYPGWAR